MGYPTGSEHDLGAPRRVNRAVSSEPNAPIFISDVELLRAEFHPTLNLGYEASALKIGSNRKVWWKCGSCGHEWLATPNNRKAGRGCGACSGRVVKKGFNDLETVNPDLVKEWHPTRNGDLRPSEVTRGSNTKVWWLRECVPGQPAHEWLAPIADRSQGAGCSVCRGFTIQVGVNDLGTTHPALASELDTALNVPIDASMVTAGSHKRVWWKCT